MIPELTPEQIDLLIALTDGSLSGEALARAEVAVRADPVLAPEYARQLEAITYLAEREVAPMAEFESARMRRSVLDAVAPVTPKPAPRWAARLLPVAAALAVVVLGIGFLTSTRPDSAQTSDMAVGASKTAATEAPAATESALSAEMAPLPAEAPTYDDTASDAAEPAAVQEEGASRVAMLPSLGTFGPEGIPGFIENVDQFVLEKGYLPSPLVDLGGNCDGVEVGEEMLVDYTVAATATWDGRDVLVLEMTEPGGPIVVVDPATCEVVYLYDPAGEG